MGRKRHGAEQIIAKLREAEVELARGKTAGEICRKLGVTEQTYSPSSYRSPGRPVVGRHRAPAPVHTPSPCPCARRVRHIARSPCPLYLSLSPPGGASFHGV